VRELPAESILKWEYIYDMAGNCFKQELIESLHTSSAPRDEALNQNIS
jgi:hypothetical protein